MNNNIDILARIINNIEEYRLREEEGKRKREYYVALGKLCEALDILFELEKS